MHAVRDLVGGRDLDVGEPDWVYYWLRPETTDKLAALLARPAEVP